MEIDVSPDGDLDQFDLVVRAAAFELSEPSATPAPSRLMEGSPPARGVYFYRWKKGRW